jgi:protein-S-isoprenylcysteine O-methyltransferase Ste14
MRFAGCPAPPMRNSDPRPDASVNSQSNQPKPPQSATHPAVAASGMLGFLAAIVALRLLRPFNDDVLHSAVFVIAVTTAAIFAVDLGWQKVHRRASTGLDPTHDDPSWSRTSVKFVGLLGSIAFVGLAYWLFPEYHGDLYGSYRDFLRLLIGPLIVLAVPYLYWVDRRMREPRDGYWQMGMLAMLKWQEIDRGVLLQHLLGWTIKGYFLALMFSYLCNDLRWLLLFDFGSLTHFGATYEFAYRFVFFVDVGIATLGYLMSFRLTDTHLRSAEPTLLGWAVTLACYEPFWSVLSHRYLPYDTGYSWSAWLAFRPALYIACGSSILVLSAIYVWATVSFGARFSNLTHRGIVTSGPYRWMRHPAYLSKNLSWWMISVPFMPRGDVWDTVARCAMLLGVNLIYYLRAKTEERHLSRDRVYVQYALWIDEHGLLRFFRRLPLLRYLAYRPPEIRGVVP